MFVTVDRYLLGLMEQHLKSSAKSNPTPANDLDPIPVRDIDPHTGIVRDIFKLTIFIVFNAYVFRFAVVLVCAFYEIFAMWSSIP